MSNIIYDTKENIRASVYFLANFQCSTDNYNVAINQVYTNVNIVADIKEALKEDSL